MNNVFYLEDIRRNKEENLENRPSDLLGAYAETLEKMAATYEKNELDYFMNSIVLNNAMGLTKQKIDAIEDGMDVDDLVIDSKFELHNTYEELGNTLNSLNDEYFYNF